MDLVLIAKIISLAWCGQTAVIEETITDMGYPAGANLSEDHNGMDLFWFKNEDTYRVLSTRRVRGMDACESRMFDYPILENSDG